MKILECFRLNGKTAFVTGGARGIGKSITEGLAEAGARVAIVDIDREEAEHTAAELAGQGYEACAFQCDVTVQSQVSDMVESVISRWGSLEIAVNNAGRVINTPAEEMTQEQWGAVIDLNLTGVFFCAQAAGKAMIDCGIKGSIINTASMSARIVNHPQPQVAYNASKAGVIMVTKSMAAEWAQYGVRVNSISPGYTGTELVMKLKELHDKWIEATPMKRLAEPDEMKGAVVYLASEASSYVTGHDLVVDGGFTLW
jgi:NAD(P)-dependent dehydrogenase (short-subunit alcohol dehydrogenase family)